MNTISTTGLIRRGWMLVVTVFVAIVVGFSVFRLHGIFGSANVVSRPSADSLDNPTFNPKRVVLEVFGAPGSVATISYMDEHAQPQRVDSAILPWSHPLITSDPTLFADLRAQGDGDFIGCRIIVNGSVKAERTTDNVNGYISCLDKSA